MATLWIEEEPDVPKVIGGSIPIHDASIGGAVQQKVTIGGASAQSSAFASNSRILTLYSDTDCYFDLGASPTATTSTRFLAAGFYRTFKVRPEWKVAVKDTS